VLLEHSSGWLELNVGSGESKKGRISHYIAVPRSYNVGDVGPTIEIVKQESVSVQKMKDTAKKRDIGTADAKLSFHDVIYWFCGPCQTRIVFDSNVCPSCQRSKMEPSSIKSVLLEIAENICIAHDNQETLPLLPALYRKCIPDEVLGRVQKALQGRKNEATHDSAFYYELDNLFYWQCNECTMTNSFRRWSCLACKKKVCCDVNDNSLFSINLTIHFLYREMSIAHCHLYFDWRLS
jgi:rubrerythrin